MIRRYAIGTVMILLVVSLAYLWLVRAAVWHRTTTTAVSWQRNVETRVAYGSIYAHDQVINLNRAARDQKPISTMSYSRWSSFPTERRWRIYNRQTPRFTTARFMTRSFFVLIVVVALLSNARKPLWRGLVWTVKVWWLVFLWLIHRRRLQPGESHGDARWATDAEMRPLRYRRGQAPFVVGGTEGWRGKPISIPEPQQYEHAVAVAPPGAGKSSSLIIPNLLLEPGTRSLIITDQKGELADKTSGPVGEHHEVWLFDPMRPHLSRAFNPLAFVHNEETAAMFAQTWVTNTGESSKEPFWDQTAALLISAAALHLVKEAQHRNEPVPPLCAMRELLCHTEAEHVSKILMHSRDVTVRGLAQGFISSVLKNDRLLGSVFAGVQVRFNNYLNSEEVRAVTGKNEMDFSQLAHKPVALYMNVMPDRIKMLRPVMACFFQSMFYALAREADATPNKRLKNPVMAYLDEFANFGVIPGFEHTITMVRSSGIGIFMILQSTSQLMELYGEHPARTILDSCGTKICLANVTGDDAEIFSKLIGNATMVSKSQGSTRETFDVISDRGNVSRSEVGRGLITVEQIRTNRDHAIVVSGSLRPMNLLQRPYFKDRRLNALVKSALAVPATHRLKRFVPLVDPFAGPRARMEERIKAEENWSREDVPADKLDTLSEKTEAPSLPSVDLAILRALSRGLSSAEIGRQMTPEIKGATVRGRIQGLHRHFGTNGDREELVRAAQEQGIFQHELA